MTTQERLQREDVAGGNPAKDLELNVLMSIEDVTARVNAAVKPGLSDEESFQSAAIRDGGDRKGAKDKTGCEATW